MHNMNFLPVRGCAPALKLSGAIIRDGYYKSRISNLTAQVKGYGGVELSWAVDRKAVTRPAATPNEAGNSCGVSPEVDVDMLDFVLAENPEKSAGFHKIDKVLEKAPVTA
jgi:hypothetical protein